MLLVGNQPKLGASEIARLPHEEGASRGVLSSVSDDDDGGFQSAMREQLQTGAVVEQLD
jgi:hypothetical protein